nr:S8 family serine peptidase [Bifidobacterium saguinibicoloris]
MGVVAVVAAGALCVPSAVAADSPGYWYVDDTGVRDAWAQGVTGEGVKVAVVDDEMISDYPGFAGADVSFKAAIKHGDSCSTSKDYNGDIVTGRRTIKADDAGRKAGDGGIYTTHGTNMMAFIVGNGQGYDGNPGVLGSAPKASVTSYAKGFATTGLLDGVIVPCMDSDDAPISGPDSIRAAAENGARIISLSIDQNITGLGVPSIMYAVRHGVIMVTGRGNDPVKGTKDLVGKPGAMNEFPGQVVTNMVDRDGNIDKSTDVMDGNVTTLSPGVDVLRYNKAEDKAPQIMGGGTSVATAVLSGYLALVLSRWPEATGNQVLQSLIRNTKGNDSGEAKLDPEHRRGFGEVDLRRLLEVDPTQYPDINPILQWQVETSEKHEETRGMYTSHADWKDYSYGQTDPFDGDDGERPIEVPKEAELVGQELDRQVKAWKKVEQCRADGGSDCMRYSATNTADEADRSTPLPDTGGGKAVSSGLPSWFWWAVGGGAGVLVLAIGGVVLAVVLARRKRSRGRHGGPGNSGPGAPPMPPAPPVLPMPPMTGRPGVNVPAVPSRLPQGPAVPSPYGKGVETTGLNMGQVPVPSAMPRRMPYPGNGSIPDSPNPTQHQQQ